MVKKNLLLKKELESKRLELELVKREKLEIERKFNELKDKVNHLSPTIVEFRNSPKLYEWVEKEFGNSHSLAKTIILANIKDLTRWVMDTLNLIPSKYLDKFSKEIIENTESWINFNYLRNFFRVIILLFLAYCILPVFYLKFKRLIQKGKKESAKKDISIQVNS